MEMPITPATAEMAEGVQPAAQTGPGPEASPADAGKQPTTEPKPLSRASERITGLLERTKAAEAERDKLKAELEGKQTAPKQATKEDAKPTDLKNHPALKGLKVDEDGDVVLGEGRYIPAQVLIDQYELKQEIVGLKETYQGDKQAQKQAETEAERVQHLENLESAVVDRIGEIRGDLYPGFEGEKASKIDTAVRLMVAEPLAAMFNEGKLTAKATESVLAQSFEMLKEASALIAAQQIEGNTEYAKTHKTQPGQQPGTKAKKAWSEMTAAEKRAATDEASAATGL